MRQALGRTFASLRIYNYRLYFIGQAISLSGNMMQIIAVAWLVLQLTHSGTQLGLVTATQFLPQMVFGLWGGVLVDRHSKRHMLFISQSAIGILSLLLGILVVTHHIELWMVYVIVGGIGLANVVDAPARQTFAVELVGKKALRNAVTLNSMNVNVARITGPAIAAVLIATVGVGECFIFNAATFAALITGLKMMRLNELYPAQRAGREKGQIRAGLRYVIHHPVLRATLLMMTIAGTLAYEFPVTLPLFATRTLHGNATTYSLITIAMSIGAVSGGLYSAGRGQPTLKTLIRVVGSFGLSLLMLAVSPNEFTALLVMVLVGACSVLFIALGNTILQLTSHDQLRGRVMALWSISFFGTTAIGGPIVGVIADQTNPQVSLAVGGASALIAAVMGRAVGHSTKLTNSSK